MAYGTEDNVDICADALAYHILQSAKRATIIILHNHPTTKTFGTFYMMKVMLLWREKMDMSH